ncbi:MAG TPA: peptidoglycan glycosyltransferase, partial [Bacillaceae bacterium]
YEHKTEPVDVFSPQTAYLMIDMMRDVMKYGTAASLPGMLKFSSDLAGKTGTSNNAQDSWLVASNPNVTMGTWIGYASNRSLYIRNNSESIRNYRIWANLMNAAYDVAPEIVSTKERFKMPGGIVNRSYCAVSGLLPSEACSRAGLVASDIFNAKFVPTKVDDSLGTGRYIMANGKKYMALPSTPEEFSMQGSLLDPEFVKRITNGRLADAKYLIPPDNPKWKNILVADAKLEDDGQAPSGVTAALAGGKLTWTESASKDVVGYRVYSAAGKKVASVVSGSTLAANVGQGVYYVVAVDVAGRESAPSNQVGNEPEAKEPEKPAEPPKDAEKEKKEEKKDNGNSGGNGNGNPGGEDPPGDDAD